MRLWLNWSWNNGAVTPENDSPEFSAVWAYTPYIEETMKQGVTLADIYAALTEKAGIDIKFITFIGSYKRIKKETGKNTQQRLKPLTPESEFQRQSDSETEINSTHPDNEELSGLNSKQRREKLGDRFIKEGSNPLLKIKEKTT